MVKIRVEAFDNGKEEEFLIFKQNFEQTAKDWDLNPAQDNHGARDLYTPIQQFLSSNILDKWLDIMSARGTQNYQWFQEDLWNLTKRKANEDSGRKQKKYLENTDKSWSMKSKEWLDLLYSIGIIK